MIFLPNSANSDLLRFAPSDVTMSRVTHTEPTFYGHQLELERQSEQGDVSNYQANGEFHLLDFTARRNVEYYSCCEEPYPDITYEIRLRRRPMFYVFNLILPCILINGVGKCINAHTWPKDRNAVPSVCDRLTFVSKRVTIAFRYLHVFWILEKKF